METSQNYVELWGFAAAAPTFSHENHGKTFYRFPLLVERLSGQSDRLNILISREQLADISVDEAETGVTLMRLDEGWDTGPVFAQEKVTISSEESPTTLAPKLNDLAVPMLIKLLGDFHEPVAQNETGACYAPKLEKDELAIDWTLSAQQIECNIRAFEGCYFILNGKRVKVLKAKVLNGSGIAGTTINDNLDVACGKGILSLEILQKEGKKPTSKHDFLLGTKVPKGTYLCATN